MGLDVFEKTLCGLNEFFGDGCQLDAVVGTQNQLYAMITYQNFRIKAGSA